MPIWDSLSKSTFGWMLALYLDFADIEALQNIYVNKTSLLDHFTSELSKEILFNLIKICTVDTVPLGCSDLLINIQHPPSFYKIETQVFQTLLAALATSGFIFMPQNCLLVLSKFTSSELLQLASNIETTDFSWLDFLATMARKDDFSLFMSKVEKLSDLTVYLDVQTCSFIKKYDLEYSQNDIKPEVKRELKRKESFHPFWGSEQKYCKKSDDDTEGNGMHKTYPS